MDGIEVERNNTLSTKLLIDETKHSGLILISNILTVMSGFFAFLNNSIVLLICYLRKKKGLALSRALMSLTTADLLMCTAPFSFFSGFYDDSTYTYCDAVTYVIRLAIYGTVGNGVIVSIERFLAVKYATRFGVVFGKRRATLAILLVWFVVFIPAVIIPNVSWDGRFCNRKFTFNVTFTVFQLILLIAPTSTAILFYLMTHRLLKKETGNYAKYRQIFITALMVSSLDFFGVLVLNLYLLNESCGFGEFCGIGGFEFNKVLFLFTPIATTVTSAVNPVVTMIRCEDIRKGIKLLVPRFLRKVEPIPQNQQEVAMTNENCQHI